MVIILGTELNRRNQNMNIPIQTPRNTAGTPPSKTGERREEDVRATDTAFHASDGYALSGTLFEARRDSLSGTGPLVLISAATGVPRGFYHAFARQLIVKGSRAVLTYDYRGMPGSPRAPEFTSRINMRDWGHRDMPAAMGRLDAVAPGHKMVGIGQSYGGQALGLSGMPERFERYCMIASLSGYWRNTSTPWKVLLRLNLIGVPIASMLGSTASWMGIGEPIPASVLRDWTRWCNHHEYFFDDPTVNARSRYAMVRMPILSVGMSDDPWGTPAAINGLMKHYVNADVEQIWLSPQDAGGQKIGHLGFFRSRFTETLWPGIMDWLLTPGQT